MKKLLLVLLISTVQRNMIIDENLLNLSVSKIKIQQDLIKLNTDNYHTYGLASYDYCTQNGTFTSYYFLEYLVKSVAIKVDKNEILKEILLKVETHDMVGFYQNVIEVYGEPSTMSLSKFYLEKKGFRIPTEIDQHSLSDYFSKIPKPQINEFPELQSITWFDLKDNEMADMQIRNKSHPSDIFNTKEVWVIFKRAK